jgi:hypothetical protein
MVCFRSVAGTASCFFVAFTIFIGFVGVSWAAIVFSSTAVEVRWEGVTWAAVSDAVAAIVKEIVAL